MIQKFTLGIIRADTWLATGPAAIAVNHSPDMVADNLINLADLAVMADK